VKRLVLAFGYSCKGLLATFRHEAAFRLELVLLIVLLPVAILLDVTRLDRVLMIASLLLVLVVELLNSALESVVDRVGREPHELSGRAKDQGSAAVLVSIVLAIWVWCAAILPLVV